MTETVTLPRSEVDALRERIEELEDILAGERARSGCTLPSAWAARIVDGESPVRVWRDYRGLTLPDLAGRAGISPERLTDVEAGRAEVPATLYRKLADALDCSLDWLVMDG